MPPTFRLIQAIREGCLTDAESAIEAGADSNGYDNQGRSMLQLAEEHQATGTLVCLLLKHRAKADETIGQNEDSLLHRAAKNHNYGFIATLLAHGANPNQANAKGQTVLHVAAASGQSFLCQLLIEKGADASLRDHNRRSPSQIARKKGLEELAKWLDCRDKDSLGLWTSQALIAENKTDVEEHDKPRSGPTK